ncbi:MAG TPA: hypothetical protein VGK20_12450 [Candidatus Binatia bacterium]|jgi:hypothetical protein
MKGKLSIVIPIAVLVWSAVADAGNGAPNGAHYNLNIIGVTNPKTQPLTGGDRHTIFAALGAKNSTVTSSIYLVPGPFAVCDGNAFDTAYGCDGAPIASKGAVFQLPCDTNVTTDTGCNGGTAMANYEVWARALGTPNGSATITTCATAPDGTFVCSSGNDVLARSKGKQMFTNVTPALTTMQCVTYGTTICQSVSLFADGFHDFLWQYDNNGLKLAQIRFYLVK